MATTDSFYTKEEVLAEIPKGRDTLRIMIGHKNLRGEPVKYLDIRVWYPDDSGILRPGKGFAKPMTPEEMTQVSQAIADYVSTGKTLGELKKEE